ncbi:MarR family winged helix-turn-helix transcriptional regulator [Saccharothrix coeruleofusca]|uniref:MarR family transcriptional regulator n=1 Tax=Saccharothrix coeruleofusca TaxID=33919 RepID=A0A918EDE8_9PSEU|nr:MarR family transcriptional regulator [Saccharothrix coeruleofusca]MBP2338568.1 DNA-binding MarR family transcriptional regulator [Saccharothrix coeruleofusca]GGP47480.1 MarR family transcriptional regulator [Saccharothrix coeruleofusca]
MTTSVTSQDALQLVVAVHRLVRSLRQSAPMRRLQPTQLLVLAELSSHGPMRIGEIAVRALCSQPTATTVVTGLESSGLVRREADPADGRATIVVLTAAGRETVLSLAHGEAELLSERLSRLSGEERERIRSVTPLLRRLADPEVR